MKAKQDKDCKPTPRELNLHGQRFEKLVHEAFSKVFLTKSVEWRRVIDTAGAGNIIGKADGDFNLIVSGKEYGSPYHFRIECKASTLEETLAKNFRSLIKAHQSAQMRLAARAGICGIYMFYSVQNDEIEIWSARKLDAEYGNKRQAFHGLPAVVVSSKNLHIVVEQWVNDPSGFLDKLVKSESLGG